MNDLDVGWLPRLSGRNVLVFTGSFARETWQALAEAVIGHYAAVGRAEASPEAPASAHVPLVVFLPEGGSVESLDEQEMARAGWVRVAT